MLGLALGRELARSLDLHPPVELSPLLRKLDLETTDWRFRGRLREVIMDGVIGIDMRLPEPWLRWLTAHAVGHYLLHTGTSLYLNSWQWVSRMKAERQAEEFAAGLLAPLSAEGHGPTPIAVARRLGIPESKAAWMLES